MGVLVTIKNVPMKLIDSLLKKLNVNRNTFFTFILTLISFYICVDRIVEMLLLFFTGVSSSYWGPLAYSFAIVCPALAFAFAPKSSFCDNKQKKLTYAYIYFTSIYIIAVSMIVQWVNQGLWLLFLSVPNYPNIIMQFPSMVRHAFSALALYLPVTTAYTFIRTSILMRIDDSMEKVKSIWDYQGIDLTDSSVKHNSYMCDVSFTYDFYTGQKVIFGEACRYRSLLVCGGTGTGKTARVFEPMIAQDIEKKYFFKEASKELGFTALKTGIASINNPYSNEYLNDNFNLNMLTPAFGKETIFKTFMKKMILSDSPRVIYRNIGLTYLSPDNESIEKMMGICDNFNVKYTLIDPNVPNEKGLNPFIYDDPNKIATTISYTLYISKHDESEEISENLTIQILENLSILLKLIYPKMHDGVLPNMEDLLNMLNHFDIIQKMCEILKADEELSEEYSYLITYLERNFYPDSIGLKKMQEYSLIVGSRLDNLLRSSKIKNILCNRQNNINFDDALANGEFIFICTRRGEVGRFTSTTLGFFFLLSMQNAVLRRPGNETSRIPHYLYIDEFPDYLNYYTETIFTMYRKYCVGTTISAQSISMLSNKKSGSNKGDYNSAVLTNCSSKVFTGGAAPIEELDWWQREIGQWMQWQFKRDFDEGLGPNGKMSTKYSDVKYDWKDKIIAGNMQFYTDNKCAYKIVSDSGTPKNSDGIINFVPEKYKEKHKIKKYDFAKYISGAPISDESGNEKKGNKLNLRKASFRNKTSRDDNPIQSDTSAKFLFGNEDAIVVNFNKKKNDK